MANPHDRWLARCAAEHAAEVARGEHDDQCEYRSRSFLCHCSKRRREAAGLTEPPGELIWQSPLCPRCYEECHHDGDGFACSTCKAAWDDTGQKAEFTDDYGDLSAGPPSAQVEARRG